MTQFQRTFRIYKNGDGYYHDHSGKSFQEVQPNKLEPHNVQAEEAVLGSLLIDPDAIIRLSTILKAEDFYIERHGWVYEAIIKLREARKPADLLTLSDELEAKDRLEEVGGSAWLTGLINATPSSLHAVAYAKMVERTAILRRLISAAGEIARLAYTDDITSDEALDRSEEIIFSASASRRGKRAGMVHIGAALDGYNDRLEHLSQNPGKIAGIPTGLTDLDKLLGGLQRSDMVIVAGRPGMGKTSLALSIALNAAKKWRIRTAIFSLEMSDEQLAQRLVSAETGIDTQRLRLGQIRDDEWPSFIQATGQMARLPIYLDDTPAISSTYLRREARRMQAEHGLDLIIVDYLQLMQESRRHESRQQEISAISAAVKALARELNVPILALSQLSRAVESRADKRPLLSDLRESGALEQDADIVLFIYRDEAYNPNTEYPNVAEIIVNKHRSGPTGALSVYFKKHLAQFVDLEVSRQSMEYWK